MWGKRWDAVSIILGLAVFNCELYTVLRPSTPEEFGLVSDLIRLSTLIFVANPIP